MKCPRVRHCDRNVKLSPIKLIDGSNPLQIPRYIKLQAVHIHAVVQLRLIRHMMNENKHINVSRECIELAQYLDRREHSG